MEFRTEFGGFEEDGGCYTILTPETPRAWENYLYSIDGKFQAVVTQRGEGSSFYDCEQVNRISAGRNFVILDGNQRWSVNAGCAPHKAGYYRCEHRPGITAFYGSSGGIESKLEIGLVTDGYLELDRLTLKNTSSEAKPISVIGYHLVILTGLDNLMECQISRYDEQSNSICCQRRHYRTPRFKYAAFLASDRAPTSFCGSRHEFLGGDFGFHEARAWTSDRLPNINAHGTEPILALRHKLDIEPGQSVTLNYAFGLGETIEESVALAGEMAGVWSDVPALLNDVKKRFQRLIQQNRIHTPDPIINIMANIWCKCQVHRQAISARATPWFNWRNHLQDGWAFMIFDLQWQPFWIEQTCRAAHEDGFLPRCSARVPGLSNYALRQRHTDIVTWLAFCASRYFLETGDEAFFRKDISYANGAKKAAISEVIISGLRWLLENRGSHGMVLLLDGDWSDPLEEAGKNGIGESPWTTMALIHALKDFVPVMRRLGLCEPAEAFNLEIQKLTDAVNSFAWDGKWYIRGIDDSGKPFCTAGDPDANISLLAQAWAVLSGVAPEERLQSLVAAVDGRCKTTDGPVIYAPAFLAPRPWIGRETAKPPGICVNGSVYSHVAMMWAKAECLLNRPDNALEIFHQVLALRERDDPAKRKDIPLWMPNYWHGPDSETPGQAGETMTGGAPPWFLMILFEQVFGLQAEFEGLAIRPCLPFSWDRASCQRPYRGSELNFEYKRDSSKEGVEVLLDGQRITGCLIPADLRPGRYAITVTIGNRRKAIDKPNHP